jgi:hypothetical protein
VVGRSCAPAKTKRESHIRMLLCLLVGAAGLSSPLAAKFANNPAAARTFRRAEFWDRGSASLLEIANVVGRWEQASEWEVRSEFSEVENPRDTSEKQGATLQRYEMAQRLGQVERVALLQNCPKLPFRDEKLAASIGLSVSDFAELELSPVAINIVFDALAESKSSLLPPDKVDERAASWRAADGSLDADKFAASLYKSRFLVIVSWFLFGKGNVVGIVIFLKVLSDTTGVGLNLFEYVMQNQEGALVAAASVALMAGVGQQQEQAEDAAFAARKRAEAAAPAEAAGVVVPASMMAADAQPPVVAPTDVRD